MVESVRVVIATLNTIEVKGKNNLSSLLGCINIMEEIEQIMDAAPAADEDDKEETDGGNSDGRSGPGSEAD